MCTGIGLVIDVEVAATKDSGRWCDEALLERREEQQWFEDGTGGVRGLWVAMDCGAVASHAHPEYRVGMAPCTGSNQIVFSK